MKSNEPCITKQWVLIRLNSGKIKAWRDYDDGHVWGSAAYTVLDYITDSYRDAMNHAKTNY